MVFSNCSLANPMDIINQIVQKIPDHCFFFYQERNKQDGNKVKGMIAS